MENFCTPRRSRAARRPARS